jgi:hypothetical protein
MRVPQESTDPSFHSTAVTDELLVRAAIVRANEPWLTAEAIAAGTGLPLDRVQMVLDAGAGGVIEGPPDAQSGFPRYSTRAHYRATAGFLTRYFDALVSS